MFEMSLSFLKFFFFFVALLHFDGPHAMRIQNKKDF